MENLGKSGKSIDPENDKSVFFGICLGISARKPVSRGPPIELHLLGCSKPISETFYFFEFRPTRQKPKKWCRNCYLLPLPWRRQSTEPCPNWRAPDLEVHSRIESSVRPNGTPFIYEVRLSSDQAEIKTWDLLVTRNTGIKGVLLFHIVSFLFLGAGSSRSRARKKEQ